MKPRRSMTREQSPAPRKCIDTAAVEAGVVCGFKREGEACDRCEVVQSKAIFIDGDFNNSYESRVRASRSKNIVHKSHKP